MSDEHYWIQKAVAKHPGKFTAYCQHHGFAGANAGCIAQARHSPNATTRHEANLANVLIHMNHKHGGHIKKRRR